MGDAGDPERVEWMDRTETVEAEEKVLGAARAMTVFSAADEERQRGVRRMKLTATGMLLFVAVVYVLAEWASHQGAGAWARYVAAAAEADMVGRSPAEGEITIHQRRSVSFVEIGRTVFSEYRRRAILGFSLFIGQAFLYNAITFGFGAILTTFFDVPSGDTGYYFAVIALGNFCGPLLLGKLFDTVGRRVMISSTYLLSGLFLFGTAWLFDQGALSASTLTACWCAVLFFASAGASSAYLTVSEVFPMETRAMSIAFFYALGTAAGGISGPLLFADLTSTGKVGDTVLAFQIGATLMCAAGLVAAFLAVHAERRSLEDIAKPLTAAATKARTKVTAAGTPGSRDSQGPRGPQGPKTATA
ncbi:hypothetical protein SAURM35S_09092 [Streptomyces aurantiogriseus]